jgi:hypothetical protein
MLTTSYHIPYSIYHTISTNSLAIHGIVGVQRKVLNTVSHPRVLTAHLTSRRYCFCCCYYLVCSLSPFVWLRSSFQRRQPYDNTSSYESIRSTSCWILVTNENNKEQNRENAPKENNI